MKKKLLSIVFAAVMLLTMTVIVGAANEEVVVSEAIEITKDTVYENKTFVRGEGYTGTFFNISGGTLELKNCVVDAGAEWELKDGIVDEWIDTLEAGEYVSYDVAAAVDLGEGNITSTAHLICVTGSGNLSLVNTTVENFYATTANKVRVINVDSSAANKIVFDGAVIRNIASPCQAAILSAGSKDDTVTIKGATKIYDNIGAEPGGLIIIYGGTYSADHATMTIEGDADDDVEIYNNIGFNANGSVLMVRHATFNMYGGEFYNNYGLKTGANNNLAPIYIHDYSVFNMYGGEISDNYGYRGSSIIGRNDSDLNLDGGVIGEGKESVNVSASVISQSPTVVGEDMEINDGMYAMSTLNNAGIINGTLYAYDDVTNSGTITGDVYSIGSVENSGTIDGAVKLYGDAAELDNNGSITGDIQLGDVNVAAMIGTKPYATIQEAVEDLVDGDTLNIKAGRYGTFDLPRQINVNIVGETDEYGDNLVTIYAGEEGTVSHWPGFLGTVSNINFKAVKGWTKSSTENVDGLPGYAPLMLHCNGAGYSSDASFTECNFIGQGVHFTGIVNFYDCNFDGEDHAWAALNYCCPAGDITVDGCTIDNYLFASVQLAEGTCENATITNCTILGGAIELGCPENIVFENNVINVPVNIYNSNSVAEFNNNVLGRGAEIKTEGVIEAHGNENPTGHDIVIGANGGIKIDYKTTGIILSILRLKMEAKLRTFTITAEATEGGMISDEGETALKKGESITYTFTADEGYELTKLIVDGEDVEPAESYTFDGVDKAHTIVAVFEKVEIAE